MRIDPPKSYAWWDDWLDLDSQIYHYTTPAGLIGIVETASIWASCVTFLNDASEFKFGLDVYRAALGSVDATATEKAVVETYLGTAVGRSVYAVCFSRVDNKLSQWRGYGSNGFGFSIGFCLRDIMDCLQPWSPRAGAVIYDESQQLEYGAKVLDELIEEIRDLVDKGRDQWMEPRVRYHIGKTAPLYKHADFREEEEARILFHDEIQQIVHSPPNRLVDNVKFHALSGRIKPYIEGVKRDKAAGNILPIKSVTIGPSNEQAEAQHAVETLLTSNGYDLDVIDIRRSLTPYRP